jgi:hypothetical protein
MLAPHNKIKVSAHTIRLAQRAGSVRDERGLPGRRGSRGRLWSQSRSRFLRAKGIKMAISPTTISIQYWPSNPRKEKCSVRNCNVSSPPFFCAEQALCLGKISINAHELYYFYTIVGGRRSRTPFGLCRAASGTGLAPTVDRTAIGTILDYLTPHDSRAQIGHHERDRDAAFADDPLKKPLERVGRFSVRSCSSGRGHQRVSSPQYLQAGPEGDSRRRIRSPEGAGDWDRFRSSAAACERESSNTGYCPAGCRSRYP